jgi:hypothetical protein
VWSLSDIRAYDLSIMSLAEAADRLGLLAAEREDYLEEALHSWDPYENARFKAGMALDILALRKAQVALTQLTACPEVPQLVPGI